MCSEMLEICDEGSLLCCGLLEEQHRSWVWDWLQTGHF